MRGEAWLGRRLDWPPEEPAGAAPAGPMRRVEILRRIDPWSALKVSLALYLCLFVIFLAAAVGLWVAARQAGMVDNWESLIEQLAGYRPDTFRFKEGEMLFYALVAGPIVAILASLATVAGVALFNLVARLFGGVELTVEEDEAHHR